MDLDLAFVIGLVILVFAIPGAAAALRQGQAPRTAAILILIGGGLVAVAVTQKPGGYALTDIDDAFGRVVARYLN